jgi:hypothetical protein
MDEDTQPNVEGRDTQTGRFLTGNSGGGRPLGSKNKLGTQFVDDAYAAWQKHGPKAFDKMAIQDPSGFCKLMPNILPREVLVKAFNVNITGGVLDEYDLDDQHEFMKAYAIARQMIGVSPALLDGAPELEAEEAAVAWRVDADD